MSKLNRTVLHKTVPTVQQFKDGGTVREANDLFLGSDEYLYRYTGTVPVQVPPNTIPDANWVKLSPSKPHFDDSVYVQEYLNTAASFSDALQLAIDNAGGDDGTESGKRVILPSGHHVITKRVFVHEKDGVTIQGAGDSATVLRVHSLLLNTEPEYVQALNGTYKGYQYTTQAAQAVFVVTARRITQNTGWERYRGAAWRVNFKDFSVVCDGEAYHKVSTIYAPEIALCEISGITGMGVYSNLYTAVLYSLDFRCVVATDAFTPIHHGIGNFREGTSVHISRCNASKVVQGWDFGSLFYSAFDNVGCDGWGTGYTGTELKYFAYSFGKNSQVSMSGCGCESAVSTGYFGTLSVTEGSCITTTDCFFQGGRSPAPTQLVVDGAGTKLVLINSLVSQGSSVHSKVQVSNGAELLLYPQFKSHVPVAGAIPFKYIQNDSTSSVSILGTNGYNVLLNRGVDTDIKVQHQQIPFDNIVLDTVKSITSASASAIPVLYHGWYSVSTYIKYSGTEEQKFYVYRNDEVVMELLKNTTQKIASASVSMIQCSAGDTLSVRVGTLPSAVSIKSGSFLNVQKV